MAIFITKSATNLENRMTVCMGYTAMTPRGRAGKRRRKGAGNPCRENGAPNINWSKWPVDVVNAIRMNLLSERIDIVKPVGWPRSGKTLSDTDMKYILRRMEKYGISSEKKIESAIRIVANENRYHPIRDYLNGLQWDGTGRIAHVLHHFLGAAEDEYTCEAMKIFLLGAIKRVFQPGCKFEAMLCLVGGQGAGKSSFFRLLAVKDEWFSDDLRRLDDDNVYRKLQGHWIIEMSEMIATANAKRIEEIKSFLSKQERPIKSPTRPILPTVCASASLLARPTGRIFCPVTAQATAASSLFRWMRNWPKSTFWTMRRNLAPISTSSGQKL